MHSYRLESFGSLQGLKLIEEQQPVPGRNQVLIKVRACSLNYRDLAILYGTGTLTPKAGLIPLSDGAGEVVATGDSVGLFKRGIGLWEPSFLTGLVEHGMPLQGEELMALRPMDG
ncbi:alcohol dehydrogenase catalytic domain-containing protein [Klebsiella pneumoniae]|nr:alcohol dehydrogenase catalytic domain-containing protein [Klebsiella pneumoniae]